MHFVLALLSTIAVCKLFDWLSERDEKRPL